MLPFALLCAATGLALSAVSRPASAWRAFAALVAAALLTGLLSIAEKFETAIFIGLWLSVAATAALTIFSSVRQDLIAVPAAINAGLWAGALAAVSSTRSGLALALPLGLVFVPGRWLAQKGYGIAVKVVASWIIAIAMLAFFVTLTPTAGYETDHME
jgi:hypothetical protein